MRIVRGVIIAVSIAAICLGGWKLCSALLMYRQGEKTYERLEEYVSVPESGGEGGQQQTDKPETEPEAKREKDPELASIVFPEVDFAALREINPEIVGWLYCEGTPINYPVAHHSDNDYYLHHLFDNTPNAGGAVFLDMRNDGSFAEPNNILYGHHMQDGSMFASLVKYRTQSYYEEHPRLLFMTPEKNYAVDVFAAMVIDSKSVAWQLDFSGEEEVGQWQQSILQLSLLTPRITPSASDSILTLSTCSYEFDDARFLVMGVLREA